MGYISMDFTDFMEMTKNTDNVLCCETDGTTNSDKYTLYKFYIKKKDGRIIYLVETSDFTIAFERYFSYIMGEIEFFNEYLLKLEDKIYE